jgi:hypothetical protein
MPHSLFGNTRKVNSSKQDQPKKTSFFS